MGRAVLTEQAIKRESIKRWIIGQMGIKGMTYTDMALRLGIHRKTFHNRLEDMNFSCMDMVQMFTILQADNNTITKLMTMR